MRSCRTATLLLTVVLAATRPLLNAQVAATESPAPAAGDLTAEELLSKGNFAYASGKIEEAVGLFSSFLTSYGASPQAVEALPVVLPHLAFSQLRLKKYEDAAETIERALLPEIKLSASTREELAFWQGVCKLQTEDFDAARTLLTTFGENHPRSAKALEARILAATSFVVEEKWKEAAAALAPLTNAVGPAERGRIVILHLYSLHQAGEHEAARALLIAEYPRLESMVQIAAFQSIALELGSHFLENAEYRKAISCLQRVWSQARLVRHQQGRLDSLQAAHAAAAKRNDTFETFRLAQLIAKVERELKFFREIENFDSALRLRLASAYLEMQRYHEAALILEQMLGEMPPDKIVEDGSVNLLQCWTQVERWPKVIDNAALFLKRFPKSGRHQPLVLFMKGQAEQNARAYKESIATFDLLRTKHPKHELAPRAAFMAGFSHLLAENNAAAAERFIQVRRDFPKDDMAGNAHFWLGRALLLDKKYDEGRDMLASYISGHAKDGRSLGEARFFKAYGAHANKDYETGIPELRAYLKDFPGHEQNSEALVLLGDALCAGGELDDGMAAYRRVPPEQPRFFEEGQFKIAKALRLSERIPEMRAHLESFVASYTGSPRLPEAIYWIGWSWRQEDQPGKARDLYWQTIADMGNDPARRSMEDVFIGVTKLYKTDDERLELLARFRDLAQTAAASNELTLQTRALWAQAQALRKKDPTQSRVLLEQASKSLDVTAANPAIIADCADALRTGGNNKTAGQLMRDLIKWNPRAPQKDRALATLGQIALEAGRESEALDFFKRFDNESPGSVLTAEVLSACATLLRKRGQSLEAIATLEKLLADPYAAGQRKASALIEIGDMLLSQGDTKKAFPYYQRVYVMYGRWTDQVAAAYIKSAGILEKLDDINAARRTYEEMLARDDLTQTREAEVARKRLTALKGAGT